MKHPMVLLLILAGCATAAPTPTPSPRSTTSSLFYSHFKGTEPRIGIYVEDNSGRNLPVGDYRLIEEEFLRATIQKGYTLASRSDLDRVQKELQFQNSGATEANRITQIGRILNVRTLLLVSVNKLQTEEYQPALQVGPKKSFRSTVSMSARLVTVSEAQVLWLSSYESVVRVTDLKGGTEALAFIAGIVANSFPDLLGRKLDH